MANEDDIGLTMTVYIFSVDEFTKSVSLRLETKVILQRHEIIIIYWPILLFIKHFMDEKI